MKSYRCSGNFRRSFVLCAAIVSVKLYTNICNEELVAMSEPTAVAYRFRIENFMRKKIECKE